MVEKGGLNFQYGDEQRMSVLKIRLLGAFETVLDQEPVNNFESVKVRALLAYLAAEADQPQRREYLAEMLWPERPSGVARANLRNALRNLRMVSGDCPEPGLPVSVQDRFLITRNSLQLNPNGDIWVDIWAYRQMLQDLKDPTQSAFIDLEEAAALYRGPFLDDILLGDCGEFQEWAMLKREYFHGLAQQFLSQLVRYYELLGEYERALKYAWRQLELARWDEQAHQQVMRILALQGNRGAALAHFETCKSLLAEEIGVQPGQTTVGLYSQIKDGRLKGASAVSISLRLPPAALIKGVIERTGDRPQFFAGRASQLRKLDRTLAQALGGSNQIAFITGDPGTGKTALLAEFARRALGRYPDLLVSAGQCTAIMGMGDPYLPLREIFALLLGNVVSIGCGGLINQEGIRRLWATREELLEAVITQGDALVDTLIHGETLMALTAGLGLNRLDWLDRLAALIQQLRAGDGQRTQQGLYEQVTAVLQALSSHRPLLLLLDDLQWVDRATASLLFHFTRRLAGSRVLILGAYRPEDVAVAQDGRIHPLTPLLGEFRCTFGDIWINLNESEEDEDRFFLEALVDAQPNRLGVEFREALFQRTMGHPLFTLEILRDLQERGDLIFQEGTLIAESDISWGRLPARVEAVIGQRIERLDSALQELLTFASIEGEQFCLQVTAAVSDLDEKACLAMVRKLRDEYRLVADRGEEVVGQGLVLIYQFSHALVRDYLYGRLNQKDRRGLHDRVASALELVYAEDLVAVAGQISYHYQQSGMDQKALPYLHLAAQSACRKFAYEEAVNLYTRALAIAAALDDDPLLQAVLYRERGLIFELRGDFDAALADQETALAIAEQAMNKHLAWQALLDLGKLWASRDYDRAQDYWGQSLGRAQTIEDPTVLAESLNWVGNWYLNQAEAELALEYHRQALAIFMQEERRSDVAMTLDLMGIASQIRGNLAASAAYYDRAVLLFRELDDPRGLAATLTGRGNLAGAGAFALTFYPAVSLADGKRDLFEALQISRTSGAALDENWALWVLSLLNMAAGRFGQALEAAEQSLAIAESMNHREWTIGSHYALGHIHLELNALEKAAAFLNRALPQAQNLHSQHWINILSGTLAAVATAQGDLGAAQRVLDSVLTAETPMNTVDKRFCWINHGRLALRQGDPALALSITQRLIASAPHESGVGVIPALWLLQGEALAALGRTEEALPLIHEAAAIAKVWKYQPLYLQSLNSLTPICSQLGRTAEAHESLSKARNLALALSATIPSDVLRDGFLLGTKLFNRHR